MFREIRRKEKITERDKKNEGYKNIKPDKLSMSMKDMNDFIKLEFLKAGETV